MERHPAAALCRDTRNATQLNCQPTCASTPPSLPSPPSPCPSRSMVTEALGVALPSTVLFDYPSIEALCSYILATQVPGSVGWGAGRESMHWDMHLSSCQPGSFYWHGWHGMQRLGNAAARHCASHLRPLHLCLHKAKPLSPSLHASSPLPLRDPPAPKAAASLPTCSPPWPWRHPPWPPRRLLPPRWGAAAPLWRRPAWRAGVAPWAAGVDPL